MALGTSVAVGAAAGGGAGYALARKKGQTGREAAVAAAKGAAAGGAGGLVVGAGLARRKGKGSSAGAAAAAMAVVREVAEAAGNLVEQIEDAATPVRDAVGYAIEGKADDIAHSARATRRKV